MIFVSPSPKDAFARATVGGGGERCPCLVVFPGDEEPDFEVGARTSGAAISADSSMALPSMSSASSCVSWDMVGVGGSALSIMKAPELRVSVIKPNSSVPDRLWRADEEAVVGRLLQRGREKKCVVVCVVVVMTSVRVVRVVSASTMGSA
jgi:hypothetical protein